MFKYYSGINVGEWLNPELINVKEKQNNVETLFRSLISNFSIFDKTSKIEISLAAEDYLLFVIESYKELSKTEIAEIDSVLIKMTTGEYSRTFINKYVRKNDSFMNKKLEKDSILITKVG